MKRAPAGTRSSVRGLASNPSTAIRPFVVQVLTHLRSDALRVERRVEYRQARRCCLRCFERLSLHALHAARIAAEQQADLVVRPVALVDADLLPFAFGQIHQFGRRSQSESVFEQRTNPAAQRAPRNIGKTEGILDYRIIGTADFE